MAHDRVLYWLDECHGRYVPQVFATCWIDRDSIVTGVSPEDWAILESGPDHESYWDTWNMVEQEAKIYLNGRDSPHYWRIYQDGGCFLVRNDVGWCDECDGWRDADYGCSHTDKEEN